MTARLRHLVIATLLCIATWAIPQPAQAACAPLSFCSCTVTTTGVAFGSYDPIASVNNDSAGSIRVRCTLLAALAGSYTIALSTGGAPSFDLRRMANGGSLLRYNLYTDAARSQIWGDGTGATQTVTNGFLALLAVDQTTSVYGRIPAGQNVAAGSYADTVVVTITF